MWYVHVVVNEGLGVNNMTGKNLEHALERRLREILAEVTWLQPCPIPASHRSSDMIVRLPLRGGAHAELHVQAKTVIRPGAFRSWAEQHQVAAGRNSVPVLAAPFVSPRLAELCRKAGWS